MILHYFPLFSIIYLHSGFCSPADDKTLELVQVVSYEYFYLKIIDSNTIIYHLSVQLFRHGARTPNDCESRSIPNIDDSWYEPFGYSQLTKVSIIILSSITCKYNTTHVYLNIILNILCSKRYYIMIWSLITKILSLGLLKNNTLFYH